MRLPGYRIALQQEYTAIMKDLAAARDAMTTTSRDILIAHKMMI
jgi:hypothetical protein